MIKYRIQKKGNIVARHISVSLRKKMGQRVFIHGWEIGANFFSFLQEVLLYMDEI